MPVQPYNTRSPLTFNTYQPDFIGKPVNQIGKTMLSMSNANHAIVDNANKLDIALSNLNVAPIDQDILIKQKNDFNGAINDIANSGNVETAQARLNKLYKDYATNQALKQSISRYASYNQQRADYMKKRDKFNPSDYNWIMSRPFTKTQADEHGFYQPYTLPTLMEEYNPTKNLEHIADKAPFVNIQHGMQKIKDNNGTIIGYKQVITKQKDINALHASLYNSILADDKAVAYARQRAMIDNEYGNRMVDKDGNARPITEDDIINRWITPMLQQYGTMSDESKSTYDLKAIQAGQTPPNIPHGEKTTTSGMIANTDILHGLSNMINPTGATTDGAIAAVHAANTFGYADAYSQYGSNLSNPNMDTQTKLTQLQEHRDKLPAYEQHIINSAIDNVSKVKFNKQFDKLSDNEKLQVYTEASKLLDKHSGEVHNIAYTKFDVKQDANQIKNYTNLFTNNSNGTIKLSNGTSTVSNNWEGNKIWDYTDGKLMKTGEMRKYLNSVSKGTRVMVEGKTTPSNILNSITRDYGFSNGIVVSIGGKQFIVADNVANQKGYGNRGYAMSYDAVNSFSNHGDRLFDKYVPLDNKYTVSNGDKSYLDTVLNEPAGTFDKAAYIMPAIKDANGNVVIANNSNELPYSTQLAILDKDGNIIKSLNVDKADKIFTIIGKYARNSQ